LHILIISKLNELCQNSVEEINSFYPDVIDDSIEKLKYYIREYETLLSPDDKSSYIANEIVNHRIGENDTNLSNIDILNNMNTSNNTFSIEPENTMEEDTQQSNNDNKVLYTRLLSKILEKLSTIFEEYIIKDGLTSEILLELTVTNQYNIENIRLCTNALSNFISDGNEYIKEHIIREYIDGVRREKIRRIKKKSKNNIIYKSTRPQQKISIINVRRSSRHVGKKSTSIRVSKNNKAKGSSKTRRRFNTRKYKQKNKTRRRRR
jgi:hypothetical protein